MRHALKLAEHVTRSALVTASFHEKQERSAEEDLILLLSDPRGTLDMHHEGLLLPRKLQRTIVLSRRIDGGVRRRVDPTLLSFFLISREAILPAISTGIPAVAI